MIEKPPVEFYISIPAMEEWVGYVKQMSEQVVAAAEAFAAALDDGLPGSVVEARKDDVVAARDVLGQVLTRRLAIVTAREAALTGSVPFT